MGGTYPRSLRARTLARQLVAATPELDAPGCEVGGTSPDAFKFPGAGAIALEESGEPGHYGEEEERFPSSGLYADQ